MGRLLKRWTLENGLEVEVWDESENYWADFWNLRVLVLAKGKVDPEWKKVIKDPFEEEALSEVGDELRYIREIVKVGIREADLTKEREAVLRSFEENALPYLRHPDFPRRFFLRRLEEVSKKLKIQKALEVADEVQP